MCADIAVLSEKLRLPPARGLARERLIRPLVDADGPSTSLVVALAGAGKTTLLSQVARRLGAAVAWYRVTAEDATAEAMAAHLARALRAADCTPRRRIADVDDLLVAVDKGRTPCAVLVDDLHEIRGTEAESALEHFVQLRPAHVRIIMGSRSSPLFNLPRLRVSGEITEVGNEDLRFRSWEVEQLLLEVYGEPLPPEAAAALTRKTGGWAAGLQLFHLATGGRSTPERCQAVAELDGRSHVIRSYLARNVLTGLSDDKRVFLTRTSTLGLLTAPLCDALLGWSRSAQILAELEESQLFTSSDDDGLSYRFHHVLQVHLESALVEELGPKGARNAYQQSAALLEAAGAARDALRAYARAEDWPSVARLLRSFQQHPYPSGSWEDLIPIGLRQGDPWFAVADARRHVRHGLIETAVSMFRHAEGLLQDPTFQEQCRNERRLVSAWTATPSATLGRLDDNAHGHWTLRVRAATRRTPRGTLDPSPATTDSVERQLSDGLCALLRGDLRTAEEGLRCVAATSEPRSLERSAGLLGYAVVQLARTSSSDVLELLEQARVAAETGHHDWLAELAASIHLAMRLRHSLTEQAVLRVVGTQPLERVKGDAWGEALTAFIAGLSRECAGESGTVYLDRAASHFDALDALVLQAWAHAASALGAAWRTSDQAAAFIHNAEDAVKRASAPGPRALLTAASALSCSGKRRGELTALARAQAERWGFDAEILLRTTGAGARQSDATPSGGGSDLGQEPPVRLRCFGGFRLCIDSVALEMTEVRPRARALLRLLTLSLNHDVHREYLVDALWPGLPLASATRSLQVSLSSLRQLIEDAGLSGLEVLSRRGDAYRFALPPGSRADLLDLPEGLRRAREASARGDLAGAVKLRRQALDLYTGDLLPEDGPADWVVAERERLRILASAAANEQARDQQRLGEVAVAILAAQESLRIYRFGDEAWELLASLHDEAGNAAEALLTRKEHAKIIAELCEPEDLWPLIDVQVIDRRPVARRRDAVRGRV